MTGDKSQSTWTEASRLLPRHLRRVRLSWIYLLGVAIGLSAVGWGVFDVLGADRWVLPGGFYGYNLQTYPLPIGKEAGIAEYDRIVALDNQPVSDAPTLRRRLKAIGSGKVVALTVQRLSGERVELQVPTITGTSMRERPFYFIVAGVYLLSGVLLFWFHPGRRESWAFFVFTLMVVLRAGLAGSASIGTPLLAVRIYLSSLLLAGPAAFYFFSVFPTPMPWLVRRPRLPLLVAVPLVGLAIAMAASYPRYEQAYRLLLRFTTVANGLVVVGIIATLAWRWRRPQPLRIAAQLRVLILASVLSFVPPVTLFVVDAFGAGLPLLVFNALVALPMLILPMAVVYSIRRHALFGIDRMAAQTAAYSGALLLVGLVYVAAVLLLPAVLAPESLARSPVLMAAVILGGAAVLRPLKGVLQVRLEAYFAQASIDPETKIQAIRDALRMLADGGTDAFARVEALLRDGFALTHAAVLLPDADGSWRRAGPAAADDPSPGELPVVIPMSVAGETVGALGLGSTRSGIDLTGSDMRALELLSEEAGRVLRAVEVGEQVGNYRLLRLLGVGGMGAVYLAERSGVGGFSKQVAIKRLLPESAADLELVQRFLAEARVAARLSHPQIVQIYELGETEEGYFIAMEYVPGTSAHRLLGGLNEAGRQLPLAGAAYVVSSICLGLDYLHSARDDRGTALGLVHGDVTPHNLLISNEGVGEVDRLRRCPGVGRARKGARDRGQAGLSGARTAAGGAVGPPGRHLHPGHCALSVVHWCPSVFPGQSPGYVAGDLGGTLLAARDAAGGLPARLGCDHRPRSGDPNRKDRYQRAADMAEALQDLYPMDSRVARQLGELVQRYGTRVPAREESRTAVTVPNRSSR